MHLSAMVGQNRGGGLVDPTPLVLFPGVWLEGLGGGVDDGQEECLPASARKHNPEGAFAVWFFHDVAPPPPKRSPNDIPADSRTH